MQNTKLHLCADETAMKNLEVIKDHLEANGITPSLSAAFRFAVKQTVINLPVPPLAKEI